MDKKEKKLVLTSSVLTEVRQRNESQAGAHFWAVRAGQALVPSRVRLRQCACAVVLDAVCLLRLWRLLGDRQPGLVRLQFSTLCALLLFCTAKNRVSFLIPHEYIRHETDTMIRLLHPSIFQKGGVKRWKVPMQSNWGSVCALGGVV
jgi:hypothetical protein